MGFLDSIFGKPKAPEFSYTEDPYAKSLKGNLGPFFEQGLSKDYSYPGQLTYDMPAYMQTAEGQVQSGMDNPWQPQHYQRGPLEAMKTTAIDSARESGKRNVIDPLSDKMTSWGIRSSYGAENPVFQAERQLEKDVGGLGAQYDVSIQNMLQQGDTMAKQARDQEISRAMQLSQVRMPWEQQQISNQYNEATRAQEFPYRNVAPTAAGYSSNLGSQDFNRNQLQYQANVNKSMVDAMGSPFEQMAQSFLGDAMYNLSGSSITDLFGGGGSPGNAYPDEYSPWGQMAGMSGGGGSNTVSMPYGGSGFGGGGGASSQMAGPMSIMNLMNLMGG